MEQIFLNNSVPKLIDQLKSNKISSKELLNHSKEIYNMFESKIRAWTSFGIKDDIKLDKTIDSHLLGIPFGAKDIFNTTDFPTEMGSIIWKNFTPGNNARVLDSLLNSGGILLGKTVTAEFAVHELNQTCNPHDNSKTPGTSSSGSAAAVACGMIPFALGSQTAGSIIRPASFCGVWGFKPSFGLIPRTGVLKTTDSLDTIGFLSSHGKSLRDILNVTRVRGPNYPFVYQNIDKRKDYLKTDKKPWRVGFIKTNIWDEARSYVKNSIEELVNRISNTDNFIVEEVNWPTSLNNLHELHQTIYSKSLGYYFLREKKQSNLISESMLNLIHKSENISKESYINALSNQETVIKNVNNLIMPYDFLISISTSSSAPVRSNKELDDPSLIWTLSHIPSLSVPLFRCPANLPYGIQLIANKWSDYRLLQAVDELIDLGIFPEGSTEIM